MRSMTGFASQKATWALHHAKVDVTMSIKAVNSRFLETMFKVPYALSHLEIDMLRLLKRDILRGHVVIAIHISDQSIFKGNVSASIATAQSYIDATHLIQEKTGITGSFSIADLVHLPNIFAIEDRPLHEDYKDKLLALTQETIKALILEQEKEGALLSQDLQHRIDLVDKLIQNIEVLQEASMQQRKNTVLKELNGYITEENAATETRKATLYHMLDKIDIHEEIVRFKSHVIHMLDLLTSSTIELGKRLDFVLQELGREINTIAAKCSDTSIGAMAIDIKVELEKAREQVQNIV